MIEPLLHNSFQQNLKKPKHLYSEFIWTLLEIIFCILVYSLDSCYRYTLIPLCYTWIIFDIPEQEDFPVSLVILHPIIVIRTLWYCNVLELL